MTKGLTRRAFFRRSAMAGAALTLPLTGGTASAQGSMGSTGSTDLLGGLTEHSFVTRPDLRPPRLLVTYGEVPLPGYVFIAPKLYQSGDPGPNKGNLIIDDTGEPVWFDPGEPGVDINGLEPQNYGGQPVLTWWHGNGFAGHGEGSNTLADEHYRPVAEVDAGNGERADLHEMTITDEDTALLIAYSVQPADLRSVGGPAEGWVLECVVQEIAIGSGNVTMEWRSLDHIPVEESYMRRGTGGTNPDEPFDYVHLNSVRVAPDGNLILSSRHTSTVYKITRDGSQVLWRLGGKASDFDVGADAGFAWQHTAELHPGGVLTLFNNGVGSVPDSELELSTPPTRSYGLVLDVDENARTARLNRKLVHPAAVRANDQGSVQLLADGWAFVGWGALPYMSLFDPTGRLVWDARLPDPQQSYRAFVAPWAGAPDDAPAAAAQRGPLGPVMVYASWNGATDVATWRVLAGYGPDALHPVADAPRSGFETAVPATTDEGWFAVAALDGAGNELARSEPVEAVAG